MTPKLRPAAWAIALLASGALVAGCASANKTASTAGSSGSSSQGSSGAMAGMNMGSTTPDAASKEATVDGIKPVPTQLLGRTEWQGMKITAQAMTAVPFVIYNGTTEQMVKPGPKTSFHLMVLLSDDQTGVPIPYASVWATIRRAGKIVFDERQWPMISRYMGPHYGNDVSLPGAGTYQLSLLVSPPLSARHVEYQNVWLKPHRVLFSFHWQPIT
jgi:Fe2+ transport protein